MNKLKKSLIFFLICGMIVCMLVNRGWFSNADNYFVNEKIPLKFKAMDQKKLDRLGVEFGIEVVDVDEKRAPRRYPRKGYVVQMVENDTVRNMDEFRSCVMSLIESDVSEFYFMGVYPDDKVYKHVYTIRLKNRFPNIRPF